MLGDGEFKILYSDNPNTTLSDGLFFFFFPRRRVFVNRKKRDCQGLAALWARLPDAMKRPGKAGRELLCSVVMGTVQVGHPRLLHELWQRGSAEVMLLRRASYLLGISNG